MHFSKNIFKNNYSQPKINRKDIRLIPPQKNRLFQIR